MFIFILYYLYLFYYYILYIAFVKTLVFRIHETIFSMETNIYSSGLHQTNLSVFRALRRNVLRVLRS